MAAALLLAGWSTAAEEARGQYFAFGKNKVQYDAQDWHYIQTPHFDVYFYGDGQPLAAYAGDVAEETHAQLNQLFPHSLSGRIPILIYQGHGDFASTNAVDLPDYAEGIGGATELFKNRIAVPFTGSYRDFRRVVRHEVVHAIVNDVFYGGSVQSVIQNSIRLRIPHWFNEGLAEHIATGWDTEADMYLREAVLKDRLGQVTSLDGFMAYKGGQSLWDYLVQQYGPEKIGEVLSHLRMSRSVERSFEETTGLSLAALSQRWHRTLRQVYFPEVAAREPLDELATPVITREQGRYHATPALSPQGDRIAYITARGSLFDVYLAEAQSGRTIRKLVDGQTSAMFESLRLQAPGLSWSPDGNRLAIAVKSGETDAIAVVNVRLGGMEHYRLPEIDQINALDWSPDGGRLAFSASTGAQSDIYVLRLATRETTNMTNDVFSDQEPTWTPDGEALVFHSDRGSYVAVGEQQAGAFDMTEHEVEQLDLYRLELDSQHAERLTRSLRWDSRSARFGNDPNRLLFLSDRNGVFNLYEKDLSTGAERPLTNLLDGVMQYSLSADGQRAAILSLRDGTPSIYLMREPFARRTDRTQLQPTLWALRAWPSATDTAPALALASETRRTGNPFMRDAVDSLSYAAAQRRADAEGALASDTTAYGGVRIDFGEEDSSRSDSDPRAPDDSELAEQEAEAAAQAPPGSLDEEGNYVAQRYKLYFTPDLIYGATGYDALYGVQGLAQMRFSDMMGNHRINISTNLLLDLRNADYSFTYHYLPRRTDWSITGYHSARLLPDYRARTYYRYRRYGMSLRASYPVDKFHRVELDAGVVGASQANIGRPAEPVAAHVLFHPTLTFTRDVTAPGRLGPSSGHRLAASLSGSIGPLSFATMLAEARGYLPLGGDGYTLAVRGAGGASFGQPRQLFFTAGVQNWINRRFDPAEGFPIETASDFIFATPVLPLRGHGFNARSGASFGIVNAELRFPLGATLGSRLASFLPVSNLSGTAFADAGVVWSGRQQGGDGLELTRENEAGERLLEDLLVGAGFGVRTRLLGYPIRADVAWPFDGQHFGAHRLYLSIGFDF